MTREQTKEAIRIMQAYVDGKEIEEQRLSAGAAGLVWRSADPLCWDWLDGNYRIKPTAKLRPWTADEVPLGAWMRPKHNPHDRVLIGWVSVQADRDSWLDEREHSTDGGKTWLPCGVEEECK